MTLPVFLWVVFVVVNVADYVVTMRWLELGGGEGNPILRGIMRALKSPSLAMIATKLPALGLTYYLAVSPWEHRSIFLGVAVVVYGYVAAVGYGKVRKYERDA